MQDNLKKLLKKEMTRKNFLHLIAVGIIGILGFGGVISYLLAHASTPAVSEEAEDGTLNSNATVGSDSNASGGEYVKFGTAPSGGGSGSPVPMMSEYASYVLAPGGDFEFAQMASTAAGTIPTGWVLSPSSQISGPSVADDVQVVNGQGLILTMSDSSNGAGGSIETNPSLLNGGFTVSGAFYREVEVTLPALSGSSSVNQVGIWMLTVSNNGEIDMVITGWNNTSGDLETGNTSQYPGYGPSYTVNGLPPTGTHKFGVYWDNNASSTVQYYIDGELAGTASWPSGHPPDTTSPWFLVLTNQGTAGINDAEGPMVEGEAGQIVIAYDRTFIPA